MFDLRKTLVTASDCLKAKSIEHALIGGFALSAYGINRATADVDFLAHGGKKDVIILSLEKIGFKLVNKTEDVLQFQGIGNLDIILANRPLSQKMLTLAKKSDRLPILVLAPEDIIGLKIQAYKNDPSRELQDKADIQALISQYPKMDWKRIKDYAILFDEWNALRLLGAHE